MLAEHLQARFVARRFSISGRSVWASHNRSPYLAFGSSTTERLRRVPAMRSPRASNCSVMMRPKTAAHPGDEPISLGHLSVLPFDCEAGWSETLAHHLLAPGPERLGVLRIEGVGPDAGAHRTDQPVGDRRYLAVLAVTAADLFGRGDDGSPDRG